MKHYIMLSVILAVLLGLTIWMTALGTAQYGNVQFDMATSGKVLSATLRHLQIVGASMGMAILIGVPIGFILSRPALKVLSTILVNTANMGQTIPTLAFIGIAGAFLGLGFQAAVAALFVYALLPIIRNTYAGIRSVEDAVIEAAKGMGMSKVQIVLRIELPLAVPVIIAGIRTATVVNVGTAAVAGMIGAGGLGELIVTGISVRVTEIVIQGAAPTAALAIILDTLLGAIERKITPKGIQSTRDIA